MDPDGVPSPSAPPAARSEWQRRRPAGRHVGSVCLLLLIVGAATGAAQTAPAAPPAPAPVPANAEPVRDVLGRSTPRGTMLGFLGAARKGENDLARQYLNTRLAGEAAEQLALQVFVVLDARLPARLSELSDEPGGSRTPPSPPGLETVGTITTADGPLEIVLERVPAGDAGPIWLISRRTLDAIPSVLRRSPSGRAHVFCPRS